VGNQYGGLRPLEDFYIPEPNTGCWLFLGTLKRKQGYGVMFRKGNGKECLAHRVFYEAFRGPIPDALSLDHLCRQRSCVNPSHLQPVTLGENQRRGRHVKLTREKAEQARARYANGETQASLAREFGVHPSIVSEVVNFKRWSTP
jgi:hypothetical protein